MEVKTMYKLAAIAVALALFAVPAALADHPDEALVGAAGIYVAEDGELFEETNEHDGLQTEDDVDDETGEVLLEADEKLLPE